MRGCKKIIQYVLVLTLILGISENNKAYAQTLNDLPVGTKVVDLNTLKDGEPIIFIKESNYGYLGYSGHESLYGQVSGEVPAHKAREECKTEYRILENPSGVLGKKEGYNSLLSTKDIYNCTLDEIYNYLEKDFLNNILSKELKSNLVTSTDLITFRFYQNSVMTEYSNWIINRRKIHCGPQGSYLYNEKDSGNKYSRVTDLVPEMDSYKIYTKHQGEGFSWSKFGNSIPSNDYTIESGILYNIYTNKYPYITSETKNESGGVKPRFTVKSDIPVSDAPYYKGCFVMYGKEPNNISKFYQKTNMNEKIVLIAFDENSEEIILKHNNVIISKSKKKAIIHTPTSEGEYEAIFFKNGNQNSEKLSVKYNTILRIKNLKIKNNDYSKYNNVGVSIVEEKSN